MIANEELLLLFCQLERVKYTDTAVQLSGINNSLRALEELLIKELSLLPVQELSLKIYDV